MRRGLAIFLTWVAVTYVVQSLIPPRGGGWWTLAVLLVVVPFVGAAVYTVVLDGPRSLRGLARRR